MKTIVSLVLLIFLAAVIILPLAEPHAAAQAPTGPQGGAPAPTVKAPQTPAAPQQQAPQGGVSIAVEVPVVTLDVIATTQHGDILTGLKKENFKVTDDGVTQTITNFGPTEAPITIVMLMEFSSRGLYDWFAYQAKYWADAFLPNLQQKDWVALRTFDMNIHDEVDFTQNKDEVRNALYHLYFPGFSESNVFDSVLKTIDDMKDVKGKKSILLLATGVRRRQALDGAVDQVGQPCHRQHHRQQAQVAWRHGVGERGCGEMGARERDLVRFTGDESLDRGDDHKPGHEQPGRRGWLRQPHPGQAQHQIHGAADSTDTV